VRVTVVLSEQRDLVNSICLVLAGIDVLCGDVATLATSSAIASTSS
jgi:hypothetical protein